VPPIRRIVDSSHVLDTTYIKFYPRSMAEFFLISSAAEALNMHPQTLRKYERLGLVRPQRTVGAMRVYTADEMARLRFIKMMVDELGINLAGVQRLLSVVDVAQRIRPLVAEGRQRSQTDLARRLSAELDELFRTLGIHGL
jgi:MerR family transcriptional regulator, heat shock protein HspR